MTRKPRFEPATLRITSPHSLWGCVSLTCTSGNDGHQRWLSACLRCSQGCVFRIHMPSFSMVQDYAVVRIACFISTASGYRNPLPVRSCMHSVTAAVHASHLMHPGPPYGDELSSSVGLYFRIFAHFGSCVTLTVTLLSSQYYYCPAEVISLFGWGHFIVLSF